MTISFAGKFETRELLKIVREVLTVAYSGGTTGPVIAGRLSEDPNKKILILEAGKDSKDMDDMHMAGAYVPTIL